MGLTVVLVLFLVACVTVMVFNCDVNSIRIALNKKIFSRSFHRSSEKILDNPLTFRTSADISTVTERLAVGVTPLRSEPNIAKPYLERCDESADGSTSFINFRISGKLNPDKKMDILVTLRSVESGTVGTAEVTAWTAINGTMDIVEHILLKDVRNRIQTVISQLDARVQFNTNTSA